MAVSAAAVLVLPAYAQQNTAETAPLSAEQIRQEAVQKAQEVRQGFLEQSRNLRQGLQEQGESIREGLQNSLRAVEQNAELTPDEARSEALRIRTEAREMIQTKVEEVRQQIVANREEFRKQLEEGREEARTTLEQNRAALQQKIAALKDERKKEAVADFSEKTSDLNVRYTDHLTAVVNNIEVILQGIISRTEKASVDGKDVSGVREAITKAEEKIAAARSAIVAQASKTYPIDAAITDDNAKTEISAVRDGLRKDLQAVKDAVLEARRSVSEAAVALARIQGIDKLEIEQ